MSSPSAGARTNERPCRTAVLGAGAMGRRHLEAVARAGAPLVGVADPSEDARARALSEARLAPDAAFADARELLAKLRPECVIVATTADLHCELVCAAAESGARYILCEKPMAVSLAQCDRMMRSAEASGARLAVNHQMRFQELYRTTKDLLASPGFGGMTSMTVVAGNIGLAMNGCHMAEAFRFLADEHIEEVTAWLQPQGGRNPRGERFQDQAGALRGTTPSGKRFYLEAGADQGHGLVTTYGARFGQLVCEHITGVLHLRQRKPENHALPLTRYYATPVHEETLQVEPPNAVADAARVLRALLDGDNYPDAAVGRASVEVLVKAWLSHQGGHRPVRDVSPAYNRVFPWA